MPELPEVEVVRRGLERHLVGRTFSRVEVLHPRAVRSHVGDPLSSILDASTVTAARRRGKFLWLELAPADMTSLAAHTEAPKLALVVHLGMSGQMLVTERPDQVDPRHARIRAVLEPKSTPTVGDTGSSPVALTFVDQRTFGRWEVVPLVADPHGEYADGVPSSAVHIAQDPFESTFSPQIAATKIVRSAAPIKQVLLNQEVIAGIGNIYADEALWAAGVRPRRRASGLSRIGVERIIRAAAEVMSRALGAGGTSFDSLYVNVNGASGYFSRSLAVYGREGQPCLRCSTPIKRVVVGGRSSHYCPTCQR